MIRPHMHSHGHPVARSHPADGRRLRLLSYNIQAAVASVRPRHYFTQSWKHVLPHPKCLDNLDSIAHIIRDYDVVGLQEVDGGSFRSAFINQVEYLAEQGEFPFWYQQTNRNLGKLAQHSNGLLSRLRPIEVVEHKLPGFIPGRGALMVRYGQGEQGLMLVLVHLALGRRARLSQLDFITELVQSHPHTCVMGDFNCPLHSAEMESLFRRTRLRAPEDRLDTFPSWRPFRNIDHILVSDSLHVNEVKVLRHALSDHLPLAMEITLPAALEFDT